MNLFVITGAEQAELLINSEGTDFLNCGYNVPCRTIEYTIEHRARINDILKIDNQFSKEGKAFTVGKTFSFSQNLTIIGINGRPVVSSEYSLVLFDNEQSTKLSTITLTVINIWFKRVSLSSLRKMPDVTSIKVVNCLVSQFLIVQAPAFIYSKLTLPYNTNSSIIITIQGTKMVDFFKGIMLDGMRIKLYVTDSIFISNKSAACSYFLKIRNAPSLEAVLFKLNFTNTFVVDSFTRDTRTAFFNISNCGIHEDMTFRTGCPGGAEICQATVKLHNNIISNHLFFHSHLYFVFIGVNIIIDNCIFENNKSRKEVLRIVSRSIGMGESKASISYCNFRNNVGGAVRLDGGVTNFKSCRFINNSASGGGGILVGHRSMDRSSHTAFEDCYFENNKAVSSLSYLGAKSASGGALFLGGISYTYISRCSFQNNEAEGHGSAIFHSGRELFIIDSIFNTSGGEKYKGRSCIYSSSKITLSNTSVNDLDRFNVQIQLMKATALYIRKNVSMKCSSGKNIIVSCDNPPKGTISWRGTYHVALEQVNVFCSSCPANKYSLLFGEATFYLFKRSPLEINEFTVTNKKCFNCPYGGVCEKGHIHAMNNFWGYQKNAIEVQFASCPTGYCCTGKLCKTFNSCSSGRESILCSKCKKGLTESVMTPACLEPTSCSRRPWLWLLILIFGVFYFLFLTYMKEVAVLFKALLCPNIKKSIFKRNCIPENETPFITELNQHEQETESQEDEENNLEAKDSTTDSFFTALFKIIIYFYQADILYKVYNTEVKPHNSFRIMNEIISTIFNLRIDGTFYQELLWCPFRNITPIHKVIFKMIFVFYLMSLLLLAYISAVIWRLCKKATNRPNSIAHRLMPCFLRLLLISYPAITSGLFSLLSCIKLKISEKVLFIDGSVQCYQWWQYVVIVITIIWVVCLPIAIYASSWLLQKGKMKSKMFLFFLTFPLASILYWAYIRFHDYKKARIEIRDDMIHADTRIDQGNTSERKLLKNILEVIDGPFRETKTASDKKLSWESVLIGRKLMLIFVKTFIMNTFIKLLVMLLFTVLFVVHHATMQPFSNPILNHVETCSLVMLTVICALNVIPAYNYTYPLSAAPFSETASKIFSHIETTLRLIFPAIAGLFVLLLLFIRFMQLIIWIGRKIFMIIYICVRHTFLQFNNI